MQLLLLLLDRIFQGQVARLNLKQLSLEYLQLLDRVLLHLPVYLRRLTGTPLGRVRSYIPPNPAAVPTAFSTITRCFLISWSPYNY